MRAVGRAGAVDDIAIKLTIGSSPGQWRALAGAAELMACIHHHLTSSFRIGEQADFNLLRLTHRWAPNRCEALKASCRLHSRDGAR